MAFTDLFNKLFPQGTAAENDMNVVLGEYNDGKLQEIENPDGSRWFGSPTAAQSARTDIAGPILQSTDGSLVNSSGNTFRTIRANTLAIIGDSNSANYRGGTTSYANNTYSASENRGETWVPWALAFSYYRLQIVGDQSVGGATVQFEQGEAITSLEVQIDNAIASGASYLMMMGGTNDLNNGYSVSSTIAAYTRILNKAIAAGMYIFCMTVYPKNVDDDPVNASIMQFNAWVRSLANSVFARQVTVIDAYSILVDPTSARGRPKANYYHDTLHTGNVGAYYVGREVARVWSQVIPEAPALLTSNVDNKAFSALSRNVLTNGLFLNGAAPGTGFTVTQSAAMGNPTATLVARSDGRGNDLQLAYTTTGVSGEFARVQSGELSANIVTGRKYMALCEVEVVSQSASSIRAPRLQLIINDGGVSRSVSTIQENTTTGLRAVPESAYKLMLETPVITVGGVVGAGCAAQVTFFNSAVVNIAVVKIGRISVVEVD